jgi:hypothetical protein
MGVVLKGGTELAPVGSTLEGEAAAEPRNVEGRGSCRAAKRGRARLLPSRGSQRPDGCFGSAGASPSRRGGQTAVRLSRSFALPKGRPDGCFGSAGASPSRRGGQTGVRLSRSFALPKGRPDGCFGSAGASPSRRGGQTGVRLSGSFALPKGRPDGCFGSAGASPSRRGGQTGVRLSGSFALPKGRHPWQANLQLRTGFCVDPNCVGARGRPPSTDLRTPL